MFSPVVIERNYTPTLQLSTGGNAAQISTLRTSSFFFECSSRAVLVPYDKVEWGRATVPYWILHTVTTAYCVPSVLHAVILTLYLC